MHFWRSMTYQCNGCRNKIEIFLEDGCEGPRGGAQVEFEVTAEGVPPGMRGALEFTPSGRMIIPVPFSMACRFGCEAPAYMSHVNWRDDRFVDFEAEDPSKIWRFEYNRNALPQVHGVLHAAER
jgi:hypothetical protein